jgi:hypothetical protein
MDQRPPHTYPNKRRDTRTWWQVYSVDQLRRAERRLRRSWRAHRETSTGSDGRKLWSLIPDWFAANRVASRRARQAAILKDRRT